MENKENQEKNLTNQETNPTSPKSLIPTKNKWKVWIWVLLLGIALLMTFVLYEFSEMDLEGVKCMQNPLVWGAERIKINTDKELGCSCWTDKGDTFTFDREGLKMGKKVDYK